MSNETTNPALTFEDSGSGRGLIIARFSDINGDTCSIQTSSLATDDALWLGQQRCARCQAPTRMHLNRALAAVLTKALSYFVATGTLPSAGTRLTVCARRKAPIYRHEVETARPPAGCACGGEGWCDACQIRWR